MTDKEKKDFLIEALKDNHWPMTGELKFSEDKEFYFESYDAIKNRVKISIANYPEYGDIMLYISINGKQFSVAEVRDCEVYSDHIEFLDADVSVMVRLSDGYVLMEYEPSEPEKPEVESVTDTFTGVLSD